MSASATISKSRKIRIVCISDTHGHGDGEGYKLPAGDVLLHAGDLTNQGNLAEFDKVARWLEEADFSTKIIVAGNHDLALDSAYHLKHDEGWNVIPDKSAEARELIRTIPGVIYLEHESSTVQIHGHQVKIFGSPWSLEHPKQNWAFQYPPEQAASTWSTIPQDTTILITHSPPQGLLDASRHWTSGGSPALLQAVEQVRPLLHVFGHHHEGRGACTVAWGQGTGAEPNEITSWSDPGVDNRKQSLFDATHIRAGSTVVVNASIVKRSWSKGCKKEFNKPIVVDICAEALSR